MKIIISIVMLFSFSVSAYQQTSLQDAEKIAIFCRLWGFLKYYHPTVAKGTLDWDEEFMARMKVVDTLHSKSAINNYYSEWIHSLGDVKQCKKCREENPDRLMYNFDIAWLSDSSVLTVPVMSQLRYILQNRNQGKNYYVEQLGTGGTKFDNEKNYQDSIFPSTEMRLLGLSRYWNIINYFYPHKYRIGEDWNKVLVEMVPKFKNARDTIAYHLAMLELIAKINDNHAYFKTKYTEQYFGVKCAPFRFKIIDNKAIVIGFYNDSLCRKNDIQFGDVFLKVGNLAIEDIIKQQSKYVDASNEAAKLRNMYNIIFNGQTDSVNVTFERNAMIKEKTLYRYNFDSFENKKEDDNGYDTCKILDGNIGYVNLGLLQPKQTVPYLHKLKDTKAIIFDVRNYPNGTVYDIAKFLNPDRKPFVTSVIPVMSYPGVYQYAGTMYCGKTNKASYGGKVILLFNEDTQSHGEFTVMALQTAPHVISVGSQTAGANGDVSSITFPGNYKTHMTAIGLFYPDGRETQRIGIVPDVEIKPTIAGLKLKRDEVLEKALEIAKGK